ncbi:hypothetical protein RMHFA_05704 [Roseomonas mucosa]|nr:hypothetical protein RMHFA_05704 [Roseomonas mucosa]
MPSAPRLHPEVRRASGGPGKEYHARAHGTRHRRRASEREFQGPQDPGG